MTPRRGWLLGCCFCVGCHLALAEKLDGGGAFAPAAQSGHTQQTDSHLFLADSYLEKGDAAAACEHLALYLANHPGHLDVRIQLGDLLLFRDKLVDAHAEYTRSIVQAQELGDQTLSQRVHCHGALMEIAEALDDDFAVHFHRGVGLYLLALQRAKLPNPNGKLSVEGLLCRSAGELALARLQHPGEARPCWYLYLVWSTLGQQATAQRWLERTQAAAPFTLLTASEQRDFQMTELGRRHHAVR